MTRDDNGHEAAAKIENSRPFKRRGDDPADNVSGGFNQKSKPSKAAKPTSERSYEQVQTELGARVER